MPTTLTAAHLLAVSAALTADATDRATLVAEAFHRFPPATSADAACTAGLGPHGRRAAVRAAT